MGRKNDAERLAGHIKTLKEAYEYTDVEQQNKVFDIVLNLNMLKDEQSFPEMMDDDGAFNVSTITATGAPRSSTIATNSYRDGRGGAAPRQPSLMPMRFKPLNRASSDCSEEDDEDDEDCFD